MISCHSWPGSFPFLGELFAQLLHGACDRSQQVPAIFGVRLHSCVSSVEMREPYDVRTGASEGLGISGRKRALLLWPRRHLHSCRFHTYVNNLILLSAVGCGAAPQGSLATALRCLGGEASAEHNECTYLLCLRREA